MLIKAIEEFLLNLFYMVEQSTMEGYADKIVIIKPSNKTVDD